VKAVILAAGVGSRLQEFTQNKPKCMVPVLNGTMLLIDYQICILKKCGVKERDIFIIGGHKINVLERHLKAKGWNVNIIFNPKYKEWNNVYTFLLIQNIHSIIDEDNLILLNSDTLFHRDILESLLKFPKDNCVVLDVSKSLGEEEMKVLVENERVKKFGKDIPIFLATGEYIGLAKFKRSQLEAIFDVIKMLIKSGKVNIWYEIAFNYVTDKINIGYIDTKAKPWIEIDTLEDYKKAQKLDIKL